ncbi:hypothetical protein GF312_17050 [Candidatus Poribacteria bacterium]|nr:hypothetical protein [Candidatus Poribacteria bacterium]
MTLKKSSLLFCLFLIVFLENQALSEYNYYDSVSIEYRSVRAMGMGNAFGAVSDDGDAFYYNPAGMANIRDIKIDFQPIRVIPTRDLFNKYNDLEQFIDDIEKLNESDNPLEDPALEDERIRVSRNIEDLTDDELGLEAAVPFRFIIPFHVGNYSLALGGMSHAWSQADFHVIRRGLDWDDFVKDLMDDEIYYDIVGEASYGGALALEIPLYPLPLELSLGAAARRIHRWQMTDKNDPMGIEEIINPDGKDGIPGTDDDFEEKYFDPNDPLESLIESKGYDLDLGAIVNLADVMNLGVTIHNAASKIGDDELKRSLEVSASTNIAKLTTPDIPMLDIILAGGLDVEEDMWEESDFIEMSRLGVEVCWDFPILELSGRIGSYHGFMTMGAGLKLFFLDFDYAFYGDERTDWHAFCLNFAF